MHDPDIKVNPEDELPVVIDDWDFACVGFGRQLTDSGVVKNVALYSKSIIMNTLIHEALNFMGAHSDGLKGSDYDVARQAADEEYASMLIKWQGPGMPVFVDDMEEENDGQVDDGQAQPIEG